MGFISKQIQSYGANSQGKAYIKFHFECDSQSDLPTQTQFETSDNLIVAMGSTAHTIANNKRWEMNSSGTWVDITENSGAYTLPAATTSSLGGIIVGTGLTVDGNGVLSADGSGASMPYTNHNGGIRGNNLGSSYTAEQKAAIAAGTFDDIYVGDYWMFSGNVWRVIDIDTFVGTGSPKTQEHHVVIMPDEPLASSQWGNSDFRYSTINTSVIPQIISDLVSDIGGDYLINQAYMNIGSSDWIQSKMMIPCLSNLFGICENRQGTTTNQSKALMQSQFALFRYSRKYIASQSSGNVWTTDYSSSLNANLVVDGACFYGYNGLSSVNGVRPYALLSGTAQT